MKFKEGEWVYVKKKLFGLIETGIRKGRIFSINAFPFAGDSKKPIKIMFSLGFTKLVEIKGYKESEVFSIKKMKLERIREILK